MSDFVDTNVFIRLITQDDPPKAQRCAALFRQAREGTTRLVTSETVVAEIVYVLSSRATYRMARPDIAMLLQPLLRIRNLHLEHKRSVLRALARYATSSLDFEDCLTIEHVRRGRLAGLYSYDQGFDHVGSIHRLEP